MNEFLDYGKYTPYIAAAYGASAIVIAAMITQRWKKLAKARALEQINNQQGGCQVSDNARGYSKMQ